MLLGLHTLYQALGKYLSCCSGHGECIQASDLRLVFRRPVLPQGLCTCSATSFSHTSRDRPLLNG